MMGYIYIYIYFIIYHTVEDATLFTGFLNTKKINQNIIVEMKYNFFLKKQKFNRTVIN